MLRRRMAGFRRFAFAMVLATGVGTCLAPSARATDDKAGGIGDPGPGDPGRPAVVVSPTGSIPYLSPRDSLRTIELPAGYRLELVLSEPVIREPVSIAFDGNGRMYVAEMRSYMQDI